MTSPLLGDGSHLDKPKADSVSQMMYRPIQVTSSLIQQTFTARSNHNQQKAFKGNYFLLATFKAPSKLMVNLLRPSLH